MKISEQSLPVKTFFYFGRKITDFGQKMQLFFCHFVEHRAADASIAHLYVEHGAHCGGNIDDACGGIAAAVTHVPAHEHERNASVVGNP